MLAEPVKLEPPKLTKKMKHHILVVDRSGSMWSDMEMMKTVIEQVLVVQGVKDPMLKVTLISYSSAGDMTVHFEKITAEQLLDPRFGHAQKIRSIRATALTCISQALETALDRVTPGETTCISLHSDGYANDRSPTTEKRAIEALLEKSKKLGGICIDTLAWRDSSDFLFLQKIATAMNGKCVLAHNAQQIEKMLRETTARLAGLMTPAVTASIRGCEWLAVYSESAERVNGLDRDMVIDGFSPKDDVQIWRYSSSDWFAWKAMQVPEVQSGDDQTPVYLYAASRIASGDLFLGKGAMIETRDVGLRGHLRAMTPAALHALGLELQTAMRNPVGRTAFLDYAVVDTGPSLLETLQALGKVKDKLKIDLDHPALSTSYRKRSLASMSGTWTEDGKLKLPKTVLKVKAMPAHISGLSVNQTEATVQLTTWRPAKLLSWDGTTEYDEVAGIALDNLKMFRAYTIFADGEAFVDGVPLRCTRAAFDYLQPYFGHEVGEFSPTETYVLPLRGRAVLHNEDTLGLPSKAMVQRLYECKIVLKVLAALLGGDAPSAEYTPLQVQILKEHCLTPRLYYSAPSTTPWPGEKKQEAIAKGFIDFQTRYHVAIGLPDLRNPDALYSGNELLQRHVAVEFEGKIDGKAKWSALWAPGMKVSMKAPSTRMKLTSADTFALPFVRGLVQTWDKDTLHAETAMLGAVVHVPSWKGMSEALRVEALHDVRKKIEAYEEEVFSSWFQAVVLWVGSTGLLPGALQREKMKTAEQIEQDLSIKVTKAEKEGSFYVSRDGVIIGVYAESDAYTTEVGYATMREMKRGSTE